jgi:hypothetical protein
MVAEGEVEKTAGALPNGSFTLAPAMKPRKTHSLELFCLDGARKVWLCPALSGFGPRLLVVPSDGHEREAQHDEVEPPAAQRRKGWSSRRHCVTRWRGRARRSRTGQSSLRRSATGQRGRERDGVETSPPVGTLPRRMGEVVASAPQMPVGGGGFTGEVGSEGELGGGEVGSVTWRWPVERSGAPRSRWPAARSGTPRS